jgi:hypothetical protein
MRLPPAPALSSDFIYSEYLTSLRRPEFRKLVWQIAQDYAQAELLLRLPGHVPMPAFKCVEDVPLVVRRAQRDRQVGAAAVPAHTWGQCRRALPCAAGVLLHRWLDTIEHSCAALVHVHACRKCRRM